MRASVEQRKPSIWPAAVLTQTLRCLCYADIFPDEPPPAVFKPLKLHESLHGSTAESLSLLRLGCSGQCSSLTDVINKNSCVKKNSLMSKLNKYYA